MARPLPVLLLAAGRGERLAPLTGARPKCLLEIGGTTPLGTLLAGLEGMPVRELVVVSGHAADVLERETLARGLPYPVRFRRNPEFATRNNIHSVWLAREECGDGLVLVNSDVLAHPDVFRRAFSGDESFLVVDPTRPPRDEAMKVRFRAGRLTAIAKTLDPAASDGEYIGVLRLEREAAHAFFRAVEARLEAGRTGDWYEAALADAAPRVPIGRRTTGGLPWIEIDDHQDLDRARRDVVPRLPRFDRALPS